MEYDVRWANPWSSSFLVCNKVGRYTFHSWFMHLWTVQNQWEIYSDPKIVLAVPRMHSDWTFLPFILMILSSYRRIWIMVVIWWNHIYHLFSLQMIWRYFSQLVTHCNGYWTFVLNIAWSYMSLIPLCHNKIFSYLVN